MSKSLPLMILGVVLAVSTATIARSDDNTAIVPPTSVWNVEFEPVPEILRMHCVPLQSGPFQSGQGLVVKQVSQAFDASCQLRAGDILLSASGMPIRSVQDLPSRLPTQVVVMRRGQIILLGQRSAMMQGGPSSGVSASAYAGNNESVSVSQNGDQISVDMSLPSLHAGNIRYRGTRNQIQRKVQSSSLPPAAIERVLEAIR